MCFAFVLNVFRMCISNITHKGPYWTTFGLFDTCVLHVFLSSTCVLHLYFKYMGPKRAISKNFRIIPYVCFKCVSYMRVCFAFVWQAYSKYGAERVILYSFCLISYMCSECVLHVLRSATFVSHVLYMRFTFVSSFRIWSTCFFTFILHLYFRYGAKWGILRNSRLIFFMCFTFVS